MKGNSLILIPIEKYFRVDFMAGITGRVIIFFSDAQLEEA